jgi:hypothetical protein
LVTAGLEAVAVALVELVATLLMELLVALVALG